MAESKEPLPLEQVESALYHAQELSEMLCQFVDRMIGAEPMCAKSESAQPEMSGVLWNVRDHAASTAGQVIGAKGALRRLEAKLGIGASNAQDGRCGRG